MMDRRHIYHIMMQRRLAAQRSQQRLTRQVIYEGCTRTDFSIELHNEAVELVENGNPEEAVPLFLSSLYYDPSDGFTWLYLATAFYDLKDYISAKEYAEKALQFFDDSKDREKAKKLIKICEESMS